MMKTTTSNTTRVLLLALTLGIGACSVGMQPQHFPPAVSPAGSRIAIRVRGENRDITGEMYAVDSIGVTIFDGILRRVSWARIEAMDVQHLGAEYDVQYGERVTEEKRARLVPLSRFPQGLSASVLQALELKTGQATLEEIR